MASPAPAMVSSTTTNNIESNKRQFYRNTSNNCPEIQSEELIMPPSVTPASSVATATSDSSLVSTDNGKKLDKNWEQNLKSLHSQIVSVLGTVDKDKVDVSVGRTSIDRDKAVVLAWNKNQQLKDGFKLEDSSSDEEGILLYLAIRFKNKPCEEKSIAIEEIENHVDDNNNNNNNNNNDTTEDFSVYEDDKENSDEHVITESENHDLESSISENEKLPSSSLDTNNEEDQRDDENSSIPNNIHEKKEHENNNDNTDLINTREVPSSSDENINKSEDEAAVKKKKKKSVRWSERLEDRQSLEKERSEDVAAVDSNKLKGSNNSAARRSRSRNPSASQHRLSMLRRQMSINEPSQRIVTTPRRSQSLDDVNDSCDGRIKTKRVKRPCQRRTRSCSPTEPDWTKPVGVLTTKPDYEKSLSAIPTSVALPSNQSNKIRRLRSKHIRHSKNIWYVGSTEKSFNSRISNRFYIDDLDENVTQYYYFRSLPKIASISPPVPTLNNLSSTSSYNFPSISMN